jgi:hypothetical protein
VGIVEAAALFIAHGGLKLIEPNARVDCKGLALHRFETGAPEKGSLSQYSVRWQRAHPRRIGGGFSQLYTYRTGLPTGPRSVQSPFTPIERTAERAEKKRELRVSVFASANNKSGVISCAMTCSSLLNSPSLPSPLQSASASLLHRRKGRRDRPICRARRPCRLRLSRLSVQRPGPSSAPIPRRTHSQRFRTSPNVSALSTEASSPRFPSLKYHILCLMTRTYWTGVPRPSRAVAPRRPCAEIFSSEALDHLFFKQLYRGISLHDWGDKQPNAVLDVGCGIGSWILDAARVWSVSPISEYPTKPA